jgi:DNA-binding NarL/FixJ family response regulator
LAAQGLTDREIAKSIGLSPDSVGNYLREIYDVAGVWNRRELARFVLSDAGDVMPEAVEIDALQERT